MPAYLRSIPAAARLHLGVVLLIADLIVHASRDKRAGWGEST